MSQLGTECGAEQWPFESARIRDLALVVIGRRGREHSTHSNGSIGNISRLLATGTEPCSQDLGQQLLHWAAYMHWAACILTGGKKASPVHLDGKHFDI